MFNLNVGLDEHGVSLYISVPNDLHTKLEKMAQRDRRTVEDSASILLEAVLAKLPDNARISDVPNQIESSEQPAPTPQKLERYPMTNPRAIKLSDSGDKGTLAEVTATELRSKDIEADSKKRSHC